jgi:hypothetical protein
VALTRCVECYHFITPSAQRQALIEHQDSHHGKTPDLAQCPPSEYHQTYKGITQTLIPNTLAVKPKASQSTDGNLLRSVVYISDTACLRAGMANDTQPALVDPHPLRRPWPVTGGYAAGVP